MTFSFLIAAPTINEVAVVLLFGLFRWKVAALYILSGLHIAIIAGLIIGRLRPERFVEDFVWKLQVAKAGSPEERLLWPTSGTDDDVRLQSDAGLHGLGDQAVLFSFLYNSPSAFQC